MRRFYLMYRKSATQLRISSGEALPMTRSQKPATVLRISTFHFPLSWSHYLFLMEIEDENERGFYEIEANNQNWSLGELRRQYDSSLYERLVLSRDKTQVKALSEKGQVVTRPEDVLKDPYVLEFLGLGTERCLALKDDTRHRKRNRDQTCLLTIQPSPF
jgi:hypothetical protein